MINDTENIFISIFGILFGSVKIFCLFKSFVNFLSCFVFPLYLCYTFFVRNKICKICGIYCYCFQVSFQRANGFILLKSNLNIEDPMEKEMVTHITHTSILAWEILWTEEPGGLQSMHFQRVGHNIATKRQHTHAHAHIHKEREREREREKRMALCLSKSLSPKINKKQKTTLSLTQGHSGSFYFRIEYYSFRLYT